MHKKSVKHRVAVAAVPGAPIFEIAVPCEVFGVDRSDLAADWYEFRICPTSPHAELAAGFVAAQGGTMADLATADTVVIPACTSVHEGSPPQLIDAVTTAFRRGARIASICSGAFVLAEAGLLNGRRATTHWMHSAELRERYPDVRVDDSVLYQQDGQIWTSAGTAAGIDMCLELVRTDRGSAVANEIARRMVVPPHRDGGQSQFIRGAPAPAGGRTDADLHSWARERLADISVAQLARRAAVSERTLVRRFRASTGLTPQQWIQRERLILAQDLLETTELTVAAVAGRTGLGTATNLRDRFTRAVGVPPTTYRRTFTERRTSPAAFAPLGQ